MSLRTLAFVTLLSLVAVACSRSSSDGPAPTATVTVTVALTASEVGAAVLAICIVSDDIKSGEGLSAREG